MSRILEFIRNGVVFAVENFLRGRHIRGYFALLPCTTFITCLGALCSSLVRDAPFQSCGNPLTTFATQVFGALARRTTRKEKERQREKKRTEKRLKKRALKYETSLELYPLVACQ